MNPRPDNLEDGPGAAEPIRRASRIGAAALPVLLLLVIAVNAPFLNQAFHMDDGLYLMIARNVRHNPLFPQDFPALFEGLSATDVASTEHPLPLTSYLLALSSYLGGRSEFCLHAAFLVFPMLLAVSMYIFAARITRHPILAVWTLLSMPVVYVMSHTLMTDIPLLSLWLASLAIFHDGIHSHRISRAWIGATIASIAFLLSYAGIGLILLLALYGILKRNRAAAAIALAVPAAVFSIWTAATFFHYRRFAPETLIGSYLFVKQVFSPGLLAQKFASIVLYLGGVAIFPLAIPAIVTRRSLAIGGVAAVSAGLIFSRYVSGLWQTAILFLFFAAGFSVIAEAAGILIGSLASARRHLDTVADDLFLGIWFAGTLLFCMTVYMTGSARCILPALPPLALILIRRVRAAFKEKKVRLILAANIALSGLLAVSLALADYQFAGIYRRFSESLKTLWPAPPGKLWFAGEWGLRAYLERMGGEELGRRDARAKPGDLLVIPRLATPYRTLYDKTLGLGSIAIAAPSRLVFDVPAVRHGSVLVCTIGMPFHAKSDGMDFGIYFRTAYTDRVLYREHITPAAGRRWQIRNVSLEGIEGQRGAIVFTSEVGASGNADADWIAVARARIESRNARRDAVLYDFSDHFNQAGMESMPGIKYHTDTNQPALSMNVWLEQKPALVLRGRYEYDPSFPLRMLEERSHAGFWGSSWGLLPFSIASPGPALESISVYEITRAIDAYGESTPSWYER